MTKKKKSKDNNTATTKLKVGFRITHPLSLRPVDPQDMTPEARADLWIHMIHQAAVFVGVPLHLLPLYFGSWQATTLSIFTDRLLAYSKEKSDEEE